MHIILSLNLHTQYRLDTSSTRTSHYLSKLCASILLFWLDEHTTAIFMLTPICLHSHTLRIASNQYINTYTVPLVKNRTRSLNQQRSPLFTTRRKRDSFALVYANPFLSRLEYVFTLGSLNRAGRIWSRAWSERTDSWQIVSLGSGMLLLALIDVAVRLSNKP